MCWERLFNPPDCWNFSLRELLKVYHIVVNIFDYYQSLSVYNYLALPLDEPWVALIYILLFTGVIATFVSHTVAALIILPIVTKVGITMQLPEHIVISSAFAGKFVHLK